MYTRRALMLAAAVAAMGWGYGASGQSTVILNEPFDTDLSQWNDLSTAITWGGQPAGTSAFRLATISGANKEAGLTSTAIANISYTATTGLKTFTALDHRFATAINHETNVVQIDFRAKWDGLSSSGESGRFMTILTHGYPAGGLDMDVDDRYNDFDAAWWARPAYHLRVRSSNTTSGKSFLQYGGGLDITGEFEKYANGTPPDPDWWLPGFISAAGGGSPGAAGTYGWVTTTTGIASTTWANYRYIVTPDVQQVWVDADGDGAGYVKMGEMDISSRVDNPTTWYHYQPTFEGLRLYWRGANTTEQAHIDWLTVTQTVLDLYWDGGDTTTPGAQGGSGTWADGGSRLWWNGTSDSAWHNPTVNPAIFGGSAGTVTVGTVTAKALQFDTAGYVLSGGTITLSSGMITANADAAVTSALAGAAGLTKAGAGTLTLSGANAYAGRTTVAGGTLVLTPAAWTVITSGGGADVQAGVLRFDYTGGSSPAGTVRALLAASYNGGAWDTGQFLCTTHTSAAGLGWLDNGTTALNVKYTWYGDASLDGTVNFTDLLVLSQNYNAIGRQWAEGDFDYDGAVNFSDLLKLSQNYNKTGLSPSAAGWGQGTESVPEPLTTVWLLALGAAAGLRRRGRATICAGCADGAR